MPIISKSNKSPKGNSSPESAIRRLGYDSGFDIVRITTADAFARDEAGSSSGFWMVVLELGGLPPPLRPHEAC